MPKIICPKDCPNRCAMPNCHNVNTCETWAAHVAEVEAEREARCKQNALETDVRETRIAYLRKTYKEICRRKRRRLP